MKVEYEKHVFVAYCCFYPYSPQPAMFWSNVISLTLYRRSGLALSYDGRGFVGPLKKKTIVGLLVFTPLWF
jgi:hypothetical protein